MDELKRLKNVKRTTKRGKPTKNSVKQRAKIYGQSPTKKEVKASVKKGRAATKKAVKDVKKQIKSARASMRRKK